jgi:hypothetical protein
MLDLNIFFLIFEGNGYLKFLLMISTFFIVKPIIFFDSTLQTVSTSGNSGIINIFKKNIK